MNISGFDGLFDDYLLDVREKLARVEDLLLNLQEAQSSEKERLLIETKRELHTIKGNSGMMGFTKLQKLAHEMEDDVESLDVENIELGDLLRKLDRFKLSLKVINEENQSEEEIQDDEKIHGQIQGSVRVPFSALDELVEILAEMVIFRNRLYEAVIKGHTMESQAQAWEEAEKAQESLGKTLDFIQDRIMRLRMVPLGSLFGHLRRIVHDECERGGKEAIFETKGGDTPMDKALLEIASEALGHIVRNAVIHGLENSDDRIKAGKQAKGRILLTAAVQANEVFMDVTDDGAGIDLEVLTEAAKKEGIEIPSREALYSLLFSSGFTTKEGTDISAGRGIGLSSAYAAVQRLGGAIEVDSEIGAGTRFRLRLPLSVSIMRGIIIKADENEYVLPLTSVIESQRFQKGDGHQINHSGVFVWRKRVIPFLDLGHVFGTAERIRNSGYIVIIESGDRQRGLLVDDIMGIREIVVKGLDDTVGNPQGVSGATILGDGRVLLILDPPGLIGLSPFVKAAREIPERKEGKE
jgi:two-component system, chemotaxis family, sensor kinase CheA